LAGTLQSLGDVLLCRLEFGDSLCKVLLCRLVLGVKGAFGRFRDCLRLLRKRLKIGLGGSAALCRGIADPSMKFLRGFSNVVKRVLDLGLYLLTTLQRAQ